MFLKRRNLLAWGLLVLAALLWLWGQGLLLGTSGRAWNTTAPSVLNTVAATEPTFYNATVAEGSRPGIQETMEEYSTWDTLSPPYPTADGVNPAASGSGWRRAAGFVLCFLALAGILAAVFLLWQQGPMLGPDGAGILAAAALWLVFWQRRQLESPGFFLSLIALVCVTGGIRELWGWFRSKCPLDWSLAARLADACPGPAWAMVLLGLWMPLNLVAAFGALVSGYRVWVWLPLILAGCFGPWCLWQWGRWLLHFRVQLERFRKGETVEPGAGAFGADEALLLQTQQQHQDAVRAAVTAERFKVELISNVSHDLRTPLTAILGYGELLERETLSPTGRQQLELLNRKAGYMRELVDTLFELTKVSSGVLESRQDPLDLIRLLEQTLGLLDDQLSAAGLCVRRHYEADCLPLVTDGARLHQVFVNLLGNAIKYALPGTRIHLEAGLRDQWYRVRVVNIASYEMDFDPGEILQRFARGDKARSTQGSGLGLAIAQTYTESVGGKFHVEIDGDQFSAIVELPKTERIP